jgi:hypothetical protein
MGGSPSNVRRWGLEPSTAGHSTVIGVPYDSAIVTDNIRWVIVGGTPELLPSLEIVSTTLIPEVTCPNNT